MVVADNTIVSLTDRFQVQRSRFKGYNRWMLFPILIKIWHNCHTPLSETDLQPEEDTIPLI
jgi:hypothetical protein